MKKSERFWHVTCKCDCGTIRDVRIDNLTTGKSKTCGRCNGLRPGSRIGNAVIVEHLNFSLGNHESPSRVIAFCVECGKEFMMRVEHIRGLKKFPCGCPQNVEEAV